MTDFASLLVELAGTIPISAGGVAAGLELEVSTLDVDFPLEIKFGEDGSLLATFPRGRLATFFDPALARVVVRFDVRSA